MFHLIMPWNEIRRKSRVDLDEHSLFIKCQLLQVLWIFGIGKQLILMLTYLLKMLYVWHVLSVSILNVLVEYLVYVFVIGLSAYKLLLLFLQKVSQHLAHVEAAVWHYLTSYLFVYARALTPLLPIWLLHHQIIWVFTAHFVLEVVAIVLRCYRAIPFLYCLVH